MQIKMGFEKSHKRRASEEEERLPSRGETVVHRRVLMFGRPVTPWRQRRADFRRDVIAGGYGSICDRTGQLYMTVPAVVQTRDVRS